MKRKAQLKDHGHTVLKRPKIIYDISDLPNEMMEKIFSFLLPSDRRKAMLVCTFWMELVNEYFPKDNRIVVDGHMDFTPTGALYRTFHARLTKPLTKRVFCGLLIGWFYDKAKLNSFTKFISLICDEIRYLHISSSCLTAYARFYAKVPKLEELEIPYESFLRAMTFPLNLKSIKLSGELTKLQTLKRIQKHPNIESFTSGSITICEKDINNESLVSFIDPNLKISLVEMIGNDANGKNFIELTTSFNYCGDDKLMPKDVSEISLHTNKINISSLAEFDNLKNLEININNETTIHSNSYNQITYFGVTNLAIGGSFVNLDNFHFLLKCFPDIEYLETSGMVLKDCDLTAICESMPKLKKLELYANRSEISITSVFATDRPSLKDLKFLKSLYIETKSESCESPNFQWPDLPGLHSLTIIGEGCRYFNRDFFIQISQKSPNLEYIDIEYNNRNYLETDSSKFIPMLSSKLVNLTLPGEGGNAAGTNYTELLENVVQFSKNLKYFSVYDGAELTLSQELDLFKRLPNLSCITCVSRSSGTFREINRYDLDEFKEYLNDNLYLYQDLTGTLNYLFYYHIPYHERIQMEIAYDAEFAHQNGEDFKIRYIVTHDYLKMSHFNLWKIFHHHSLPN